MNVPAAGPKRLVIVGATGMVGGYALRYALDHPTVGHVTAIGRKRLGTSHPKLEEVLHRDFADCSALAQPLSCQDAAVFCLGTYTGSVSDAELRQVTVDYTNRVRARSPQQQPRRGFLVLERKWRGPDRTKSDGLRTL
jgi:uncharacterized protein YbjT (DUF2867 family)